MPRLQLQITAHSAPGSPTRANQDACLHRTFRDESVLAVLADGVGSARAGGEAARRAVEMLADYCSARTPAWSPRRALQEFILRLNRQLHQESLARFESTELVATLAVVLIVGARAYLAALGDSPIYLRRNGRLARLSELHLSPLRGQENALTQALGLNAEPTPWFHELDLETGDTLILCSDGVAIPLGDIGLGQHLARGATARSLVTAAQDPELPANEERSQPDDATAVVLEVSGRDDSATPGQTLEIAPPLKAGDTFPDGTLLSPLDDSRRVWLAQPADAAAERIVLKFPPAEAADDENRTDGFLREAWQAARLLAPEFVPSRVPATPILRYYVQDYIDAPTLRTLLRNGPLPVERAVELGAFLARAAQHLVRLDLAHGDIKPENILVLRSPEPSAAWDFRLIDLGIAAELYAVTTRAGTSSYLAPERFANAPISERTEMYAIGATVYECLTGRLPYGEIERFQTPSFATQPKPPSAHNPAVPAWVDSLVLRALAASPEERYSHYSEFAHDLANPQSIAPFHPANAPLLVRAPLRVYKTLCALLLLLNFIQLWLRFHQR